MKMSLVKFLFISMTTWSSMSIAHEGDHGPALMEAPNGGVIRSLETIHLELVSESSKFKLYLFSKDGKPGDTTKIPIKATLTRPKQKSEALKLDRKNHHWEASFDPKGAHRVTVVFDVEQGGHRDKVEYTIEPKG